MKSHGFAFDEDYLSGKTKYFNQELEIEFLSKITRENKHVIEMKNLGIGVECLSGLELIDHNYIVYSSPNYGVTINLPTPAAYCIHKILINDTRTQAKARKDAEAIRRLLPFLIYGRTGKDDFLKIYKFLSRKQTKTFLSNAKNLGCLKCYSQYWNALLTNMIIN